MKYYLCATPEGPQLAATQAKAKALDPQFVEHHVPDDKDARMDYINKLLRAAHAPEVFIPADAVSDEDAEAICGGVTDPVIRVEPPSPYPDRPKALFHASLYGKDACPYCSYRNGGAHLKVGGTQWDEFTDWIGGVEQPFVFRTIVEWTGSRAREVGLDPSNDFEPLPKAPPAPAPRARVRKAAS